jgi:hypothetical protein
MFSKKGGMVVILRPDYPTAELEDARKQCAAEKQIAGNLRLCTIHASACPARNALYDVV